MKKTSKSRWHQKEDNLKKKTISKWRRPQNKDNFKKKKLKIKWLSLNYQIKPTKPTNPPNKTNQTKQNLPNKTYKTKPTRPNLPNQNFQRNKSKAPKQTWEFFLWVPQAQIWAAFGSSKARDFATPLPMNWTHLMILALFFDDVVIYNSLSQFRKILVW